MTDDAYDDRPTRRPLTADELALERFELEAYGPRVAAERASERARFQSQRPSVRLARRVELGMVGRR